MAEVLTLAAAHRQGNDAFSQKDYREALRLYAVALSRLADQPSRSSDNDADKQRAATLRSNRALCCLRLGSPELALAEADKCEELRPDWPKAHFRKASALEALGQLGDARLALCAARRLAPEDQDVASGLKTVRKKLFGSSGPEACVGEALDVLEDFSHEPEVTQAAARQLRDLVLGDVGTTRSADEAPPRRDGVIRAFVEGRGAATLFRRQNAMGPHWKEECKNGTMQFLSEVAKAAPQLEEALSKLNLEADTREQGLICKDGVPGCKEPPKKTGPPPPPKPVRQRRRVGRTGAKPLSSACEDLESEGEVESNVRAEGAVAPAETTESLQTEVTAEATVEATSPKATELQSHAAATRWKLQPELRIRPGYPFFPRKVICRVLAFCSPPERAAAASLGHAWAAGARAVMSEADVEELDESSCRALAESVWPSVAELLRPDIPGHVWRQVLQQPAPRPQPPGGQLLAPWVFFADVRREDKKSLWRSAIGQCHALPGVLAETRDGGPPAAPSAEAGRPGLATTYERMDVAVPGDKRRLSVAGAVSALSSATEERRPVRDHFASVVAVHATDGRVLSLPAVLVAGSRHAVDGPLPPGAQEAPLATLTAVAGLGVRNVLPGPRAPYPFGSLEVRVGLAFLGPDGGWLRGGALAIASMLEAAWAIAGQGGCAEPAA